MEEKLLRVLACTNCGGGLSAVTTYLICKKCKKKFKLSNGKPCFIKVKKSITEKLNKTHLSGSFIKKILYPPSSNLNLCSKANYTKINQLFAKKEIATLVIGSGSELGSGMGVLHKNILLNAAFLDISPEFKITNVIADAHNLPFKSGVFDLVIIQAVLEHVKYPVKVVSEICRVLKTGGYVYSETPFMQHIHADPYDFQRYTDFGEDVLFEQFKKIDAGVAEGPSSALSNLSIEYVSVLLSFNIHKLYSINKTIFGWLFFPIKYIDLIIGKYTDSKQIASGFYYLGRK